VGGIGVFHGQNAVDRFTRSGLAADKSRGFFGNLFGHAQIKDGFDAVRDERSLARWGEPRENI